MVALGNAGGELQSAEVGETLEDEGVNFSQHGERQRGELGNVVEGELSSDGLEGGAAESLDVGVALNNQITLDRLDAIQGDVVAHTGRNGNAAGVCGARGNGRGIAAVLDCCGPGGAAGGWQTCEYR